MTRIRMVAWAVAGGGALYLASWLPALFFSWQFHGALEGRDPAGGIGAVLRAKAVEAAGTGAAGGWDRIPAGGLFLPLPPGPIEGIEMREGVLVLRASGATLSATRLAPGSIRDVYLAERGKVSGGAGGNEAPEDLEIARRAASTTPADYRLSMSAVERMDHAAILLTKVLLWAPDRSRPEVAPELRTFRSPGGEAGGVVARYPSFTAVLAVAPGAVVAWRIDGPVPPEWLEEPRRWAEIAPAGEEAAVRWRAEARARYPAGHPSRKWAEKSVE